MKRVDVVVAGAGPAGLMTGAVLAEAGYQVLVLEAGQFGRSSKAWLTFGETVELHGLDAAVQNRCRRGLLRFYTEDCLAIERPGLICVLDEERLLALLAARLRSAGGYLWQESAVLGYEHKPGDSKRVFVVTARRRVECNLLIDATAGRLSLRSQRNRPAACYVTYARTYEGCVPRLPLDEVVLLERAYPGPSGGQWSAPVSESRYLLGEFNFWTSVMSREVDLQLQRRQLAERLDRYTWEIQSLVEVPRGASYREHFGQVDLRCSHRTAVNNLLTVGDSAGQARPFFGVSLDQVFDQTRDLREVVDRAFGDSNFSAGRLSEFRPANSPASRMNFHLGMVIWHILRYGSDPMAGRLCATLDRLDEDLKYDLLRTRLSRPQLRWITTYLHRQGVLTRLVRSANAACLSRLAISASKCWGWYLRA